MLAKLDIGPLVAALGAVLLLVSLFLDWYETFTAWQSFELVDALLAALAVATGVAAAARTGLLRSEPIRLELLAAATLILVALQLIDQPPTVGEAGRETGAWLALGAAVTIATGAALTTLKLSVQLTVAERRGERPAVDRRDAAAPPDATERPPPTQPMSRTEITGERPAPGDARS